MQNSSIYSPKRSGSKKIIVIGAGLSGLTATYRLLENGFDVKLFEARNRVGGRVFTVNINGHIGELGGQNILNGGKAQNTITLAQCLGLELKEKKTLLNLHYFHHGQILDIKALLKDQQFIPENLKLKLKALALKTHNMREILLEFFTSQDPLYEACSTLLAGYEGAPIEKLSPIYIETLYHILLGGISSAHPSHGEETLLDQLMVKGGNGLLPEKLAEKLSGRIYLNQPLQTIKKEANGTYFLGFKQSHVYADVLILTIPCPVYKSIAIDENVLSSEKRVAIESFQNGTTEKILLPIVPTLKKTGSHTDGRIITFTNDDDCLLNMYYAGHHSGFRKETIDQVFQEELSFVHQTYTTRSDEAPVLAIDQSFGLYNSPVAHSWINDPFAKGSYSYVGASQEEMFTSVSEIHGEKVKTLFAPIDNTLFFAGEHTSVHLDIGGTMEGAIESGERAARMVQKHL